jgi:type IV pilus assembly protein PilY1
MNKLPVILRYSALALSMASVFAQAEDIDLYAGATGTIGAPNVLFFIDNSSNWSTANQAWDKNDVKAKCASSANPTKCSEYTETIFGASTSLTQGQVELRALKLVLNELVCGANGKMKVNAGLMLFNDQGTIDSKSAVSGYIRHRIDLLDQGSAHCSTLLNDLSSIDAKITTPEFKGPSSAAYGGALYEAFKYFGGWTNPAGAANATAGTAVGATGFGPVRNSLPIATEDAGAFIDAKTTYKSPLTGDNLCGNNYIVVIGNTWPNQEWGTDTNASPNPTNTMLSRLGYKPPQLYPVPLKNSDKSDIRFADEWAAFLYQTDVSAEPGIQNIRMFTVDVYNKKADASQAELLKSMADQSGPGGYFTVGGDIYRLITAFTDILTQIASVNSVFAAASLPVSVNTQGTFLNQVFMGVFRPDGGSQQRWLGNVKQYRFSLSGETLALTDKAGQVAVDAQNTGFLQHCATSFWTTNSDTYWQTVAGLNTPSSCTTSLYSPYSDAPDGPIVERGAAAQQLRNLGHAFRNIRTCSSDTCSSASLSAFTTATMGANMDATLVAWLRGENKGDGASNNNGPVRDTNGNLEWEQYGLLATATRPTVHGDVVHSRPLAINYGVDGNDDVVVFYGAGDGMLRAIDGNQEAPDAEPDEKGKELWAFVAPEHWSKLGRLRSNSPLVKYPNQVAGTITPAPEPRSWFFDGSIGGYLERTDASISKVWIYPTMRRGGAAVYAFDVTARPSTADQPTLLWRYSDADDSRMGESWSTPVAIRVKGVSEPLVVFGAGYDKCEDTETPATDCSAVSKGKGILILDAEQGKAQNYRFIGVGDGELDSSAGRFVADITAVDVDRDGYTDVLYAADTRGNVWRINTSDPAAGFEGYADGVEDWPVNKIAEVGDWGNDKAEWRKFLYAPSTVTLATATSSVKQVTVLIGSGDREKPSATSNSGKVVNRFYGIFDDVTKVTPDTIEVAEGFASGTNMKDVTNSDPIDPSALASYKGWYLNLSSSTEPYEQVVTTPLTIAGETFFNTFQAKSSSPSACLDLGTARGYRINFQTGTRLPGYPLQSTFISPGFPPSPVGGTVLIDGVRVPFVIGGQGKTPILPQKLVPKVKATREPVYRFMRVD